MKTNVILGMIVPALALAVGTALTPGAAAQESATPAPASDTQPAAADATEAAKARLARLLKEASLSRGVADVAKLGDVGAGESVMLAYVNNSETAYKLRADDIAYLLEHRVPDTIVTAMIERGAILRDRQPAPAPAPSVQNIIWNAPQPANTVTFIPAPVSVASEPVSTVTVIGRSDLNRGLSQWNHPYHVARPGVWRNYSSYSVWGSFQSCSPYTRPVYKYGNTRLACR